MCPAGRQGGRTPLWEKLCKAGVKANSPHFLLNSKWKGQQGYVSGRKDYNKYSRPPPTCFKVIGRFGKHIGQLTVCWYPKHPDSSSSSRERRSFGTWWRFPGHGKAASFPLATAAPTCLLSNLFENNSPLQKSIPSFIFTHHPVSVTGRFFPLVPWITVENLGRKGGGEDGRMHCYRWHFRVQQCIGIWAVFHRLYKSSQAAWMFLRINEQRMVGREKERRTKWMN